MVSCFSQFRSLEIENVKVIERWATLSPSSFEFHDQSVSCPHNCRLVFSRLLSHAVQFWDSKLFIIYVDCRPTLPTVCRLDDCRQKSHSYCDNLEIDVSQENKMNWSDGHKLGSLDKMFDDSRQTYPFPYPNKI